MNDEYLKKLYGWVKANDSSYGKSYSYEQFSNKMEDKAYAQKMHGWVKGIDQTFFSLEDFNSKIKKKSQSENGGSIWGGGSSVSPKTEGDYTYGNSKSAYRKQGNEWLINNESTGGQYVAIKDPTGSRAAELNKNARKMSSLDVKSQGASIQIEDAKDLTSIASKDSEIFTGYPGKEKNKYEFKDGSWYEPNPEVEKIIQRETEKRKSLVGTAYEKTIAINIKNAIKDIPKTRVIEDDARIKALNKQFGKNASLYADYKTFGDYDNSPEKKDNKYRIKNNSWERLVSGATEWSPISNEGSINALNNRYGQNIDVKKAIVVNPKEIDPFLKVNTNFLGQSEESAQQMLEKNFKGMGFTFEQTGAGTDYITVTPNNGAKPMTFSFDEKSSNEAVKLQSYLRLNASAENEDDLSPVNKIKNKTLRGKAAYIDPNNFIENNKYYESEDYKNAFKQLTFQQKKNEIYEREKEAVNLSIADGDGWLMESINEYVFGDTPNAKAKKERLLKAKQTLHKSEEYKLFVSEQEKYNEQQGEKYNKLYDELVIAKQSGDKEAIKTAKLKIEGGFSKDVIGDNLNHMTDSQYDLQRDINIFIKNKEKLELDAKNKTITQEQYNDAVEGLSSEAQRLDIAAKNVAATQKKMNALAGVYVTEKAKSGGFFGNFTNALVVGLDEVREPLSYIFPLIGKDLSGDEARKISLDSKIITPQQRQYYKDKGFTDEQIKNVLLNNVQKNAIAANKRAIIETFGSDLTTEESKQNLSFFEQALVGVAASLPSMLTRLIPVVGQVTAFGSMANMSYNAINEEMLNDTDFETTSEADRALVAVPYSLVMGYLENVGLKNMTAGKSAILGKYMLGQFAKIVPKKLGREALENIVNKEVKSLVGKGVFKVVSGGFAEAETGAIQTLVADIGIKKAYNSIRAAYTGEDLKELTGGEAFGTPKTFMEGISAIGEGALAEAIGGVAMSTVMVGAQGLINGKISLYNEEDLKFFEDFSSDQEFKKLIVSNLKTEMLNGTMTKGEAQSALNDIDLVEGVFNSIDENLPEMAKLSAFNLINERNRLEKEKQGKDPALSKVITDRINEINDKLAALPKQVQRNNNINRINELESSLKQRKNKAGTITIEGKKIPRTEVETELKQLNQKLKDAIQEQAAGQVPVQPTTAVGEEVVQGEPTAEPQVLTEEGKAEEVAPLTIQEELQLLAEEQAEAPKAPVVEAPTLEAPVIEAPIVEAPTLETPVVEVEATPQEKVATYRAEEQAELLKAIPKIESYKVKGKIDKNLMPKTVLAKYNKIYEKYDALISPLLEPVVKAKAPVVKAPVVKAEASKAKGELPVMSWSKVEEYDDAVIRSMKEIQYGKLKPLRDLGKRTTVAQKEDIRTIEAKIATAERILDRRANKIKKEAQRVEKEGKGATVRAVDNNGTEAEYSVMVSKDGATAKVQLKKIGTLTPKRATPEANLTIQTDENKKRFVETKNKTKVYIDEAITPAKVETTKSKVKAAPVKEEVKNKVVLSAIQKDAYEKLSKKEKEIVDEIIFDENYERSIGAVDILDENLNENQLEDEINRSAISFEDLLNVSLNISLPKIKVSETNEKFTFGGDIYDIDKANEIILEDELPTVNVPVDLLSKMSYSFIGVTENTVKNADITKPVILVRTKDGLLLIDGHHRVRKAIIENKPIKAFVLNESQTNQVKEQSTKKAAPVKEEVKEEAPAPAKESTEDLMGAINSIKEEIDEINKDIAEAKKTAKDKILPIRDQIEDLDNSNKTKDEKETQKEFFQQDIEDIEKDLKEELYGIENETYKGLVGDLNKKIKQLKEEVKKIEDLDAKNPENKKTLIKYIDSAIATLNGLNKLSYVKFDLGVSLATLKLILKGIRAGVIAGNTISASIKAMASQYRGEHKNKKITIAEFTKEIEEYLRNTFVDQKTNEQDIQETRAKFVEIREAVRKAKVAVKTESKALRANAENAIREMLKGKVKNLTAVQMKSIMLRLARFNVFSQSQYDKFIDYVDKVIGIADYDAKVAKANENRKTAKKNLPKLGDISSDLLEPLSRVLNINAKLIPKDVFESYSEIVEMLSKRDAILELNKRTDLNESLDKIIESIELNEKRVSDLKELYDNFTDKVVKNGVVNYTETLDKMLEDGVIDKTEHELMKTFKSKIQGAKVKEKMTEQEIADEKAELIDEINNTTITLDEIVGDEFRLERDLVKKLQVLLKNKESLESLNNKDLKDLLRIIDNINNGFVSNATQQMVERLNFIEKSVSLEAAIPKTVAGIFKKIKQYITDRTSRDKFGVNIAPLFNIDEQFGDFKTKTIFNAVFEQSAVAQQIYQSEITDIQGELTQVEKAISNIFKNNGNKVVLSKFKMMVYMMQLEYNSNPNNKQVHQAMKTLDETIKFAKQNSKKSGYKAADIKQMEFIKEQFAKDGEIDIDKLYNSFNEAEKNALKKLQDINNRMTKKATYTASVINGKKIKPIKNYVFYNTISASDRLSTAELINNMSNNMNPTTTSKNLEERDGKVHPVNLNAFFAVNQSARSVLINYHMTEPIRTARKTLSKAMKLLEDNNATTDQYEILNTIGEAYDTATRDLLQSNFTQSNEVMNWLQKTGYRSMLASAPRAISELMSNVSFVLLNNPRDMAVGMNEYWALSTSEDAKDILTILGSKVTSRNYPSDKLSSGLVDLSAVTSKLSKNRNIQSREVNGVFQLYDNTLGKWVNGVEFVADNLISQPDKIVMKPLWFGAFARSFQKETGVAPDFDKIKANNEEYMDKYRDALVKAKNNADTQTISAGSSTNAYMGILQNVVREGDSSTKQIAKNFNKFMNKFTVQEYYTARKGVNAFVGNGDIPWEQGAQILAAVTARMTIYVTATKLLSELMLSAFGYGNDDDDEDKKTMLQRLYQGVVSSATTLLIGRSFGNIIRVIENSLIEKANEEYGEKIGLRNGEYDPYEDAVQFNQLQKGKIDEPTDLVKIIAGPYAPLIGVGELGFKLLEPEPKTERAKLTRAKEWYRAGMETLGLLGAVPFYRDIKKIALAEVYKELKKETKEKAEKTEAKEIETALTNRQKISSLRKMRGIGGYTDKEINKAIRIIKDPEYKKAFNDKEDAIKKKILDKYGYENLEDFERNDEKNYEIEFGDDSPYRIERAESAKIANELEKRINAIKDGKQYVPKKGLTPYERQQKERGFSVINRPSIRSSYSRSRKYSTDE